MIRMIVTSKAQLLAAISAVNLVAEETTIIHVLNIDNKVIARYSFNGFF